MNAERWQRLKAIVADALEEESEVARTRLVTRECADDTSLLREAESFLTQARTYLDRDSDDLELCAERATALFGRERTSLTGHRIGAYVIVRELGQGGMGTVYLAARADGYFEKQVAIKVLTPGANTVELIRRFRAEREVLASLDHPNIAALFDAGTTEEGMPYFVMEYVCGTPVTTHVRGQQLPVRERLLLFLKICAAVEAAHRKRIVHRDLKRSNILVTEEGEPKLLDFGIAKLLEENPLAVTATGEQRLTPISASPEQARGEEVTTASDIYALGALLYEILTDQTPHVFPTRNPDLNEVARVISESDPVLPSLAASHPDLQRALRGDLDAVILRAMRKDPSQRYPSVGEFESDIRHYLAGEPVQARPITLHYRLRRFLTRHQVATIWLTLAAVAVIIALGAALLLPDRQSHTTAREIPSNPASKVSEKSIAVLPFDDFTGGEGTSYFADGVQDDILTDLAQAAGLKVISRSGVAPYRNGPRDLREIGQTLGVAYVLEGSVRRLNDRVRVNAQLIDTRSDAQVWAQQYDRKMDDLFALQSELAQSIVAQLKGRLSASAKAAIETPPTKDAKAYDLYLQAKGSFTQYKYQESVELLNEAIARDPNFALAYCLLTDVHLYIYRFGADQSPERLAQAKRAAETALRLAPDLPESHLAQAQYYYNGLRDYEKAQAELTAAPPSPAGRAKFFDLTALTERRLGHWKEALRNGEKAWELDPHDPFIPVEVIQSYMSLKKYPEAEKLADKATKLITTPMTPFWSLKAECILAQGDPTRARAFLETTVPPSAQGRHTELARVAFYERRFGDAFDQLEAARKAPMGPRGADIDLMEGTFARAQGDAERAKQAFERARVSLEASLQKRPDDSLATSNLSWAYAGLQRKEDALRLSQRSVQLVPSWRDAMEGPSYASMQAMINAWVGETDIAIQQLGGIVKQASGPSYGELKFDPGWDDLRSDPRFEELTAEAAKPVAFD